MSKVIEFADSLVHEGASIRMAVLFTIHKFKLGELSSRQLWAHYNVVEGDV